MKETTKQMIIRKLTSRKLWAAVCSFVVLIMTARGFTDAQAAQASAIIMAGAVVLGRIRQEQGQKKSRKKSRRKTTRHPRSALWRILTMTENNRERRREKAPFFLIYYGGFIYGYKI